MAGNTSMTATARLGKWLPSDPDALEDVLADLGQRLEAKEQVELLPVIREFHELIARDPVVRMYLTDMIAQVPHSGDEDSNHPESVDDLLLLIDEVLRRAPEFNESNMVATPLSAILVRTMGTPAGLAAFRHEAINGMFKKVLTAWCEFLSGPESLYVLNSTPRGWMCDAAQKAMKIEEYRHDPRDPHWGFSSWNDFFTRRFKEGMRPVAEPDNDKVVVTACEAAPYRIAAHVKEEDEFWIKSQPYSLRDMLADDESVGQFVGGTVYQAYLSATDYHRWHSPISGTIRKAFVREGTYFSETDGAAQDPSGAQDSQGYLAHVATRALIFIEADNPTIGLMCASFIGMMEVSSCVIHPEITPGRRVKKGDELGYFQFGGSTYCLVFRPGAIADISLEAIPEAHGQNSSPVPVNTKIATAP